MANAICYNPFHAFDFIEHAFILGHFQIFDISNINTSTGTSPVCLVSLDNLVLKMEETDKKVFKEIVENIFVRWSALKLAVEHGMGGRTGQQVKLVFQPNQTFARTANDLFTFRPLWKR